VSDTLIRLLLVALLIAVNGFFAGAEVALLSVRQSRLRQMAAAGQAGAHTALQLLANPSRLLSVTQVGVTLASLGLGWAGEETVYDMLTSLLARWTTPASAHYWHAFSFAVAFLAISYCHVVIGEVVPKNLAISKADRLAVLVAGPLLLFYRASLPFVVVLERSARFITGALHLRHEGHGGGHSPEELRLIVSASRGSGHLPEQLEDMIQRVLDLTDMQVREVMIPRNRIVSIPAESTLDFVLQTMIGDQHSRLPVYEGSPEKIVGILHYKDLLPIWNERRHALRSGIPTRAFRVHRLLRKHLVVPETKPLAQMIEEFRVGHSHMAMVVDEFGTITGLLTVEDVLEQVVGRIEDEHDKKTKPQVETEIIELDGTTRIRDLETGHGVAIPAEAGFETLAGFLLFKLGAIPHAGESVIHDGRRYTVLEMERMRIARVRIERCPKPGSAPGV
jgi:putative hemolysin